MTADDNLVVIISFDIQDTYLYINLEKKVLKRHGWIHIILIKNHQLVMLVISQRFKHWNHFNAQVATL
jgi:hypothetical protein